MSNNKDVADILERAADLIEPEGKWIQRTYARDRDGKDTVPFLEDAVCWCAEGAINAAAGEWNFEAEGYFGKFLGRDVPRWNDDPERTQAEVVAKLREAAAKARAS